MVCVIDYCGAKWRVWDYDRACVYWGSLHTPSNPRLIQLWIFQCVCCPVCCILTKERGRGLDLKQHVTWQVMFTVDNYCSDYIPSLLWIVLESDYAASSSGAAPWRRLWSRSIDWWGLIDQGTVYRLSILCAISRQFNPVGSRNSWGLVALVALSVGINWLIGNLLMPSNSVLFDLCWFPWIW